jgi:predicted phosphodiesterase
MPDKTALISDIHGNPPALRAALTDIQHTGCDRMFVLGDIINGYDPNGCMDLLKDWQIRTGCPTETIKGNAEFYLLTPDLDEFPDDGSFRKTELIPLLQWFAAQLSPENLTALQCMPDTINWRGAVLVHDSPIDRITPPPWNNPNIPEKYRQLYLHGNGLQPDIGGAELKRLLDFMTAHDFNTVFAGHTHTPWIKQVGEVIICNTGSVGMPLDGDPCAAWVLVEEAAGAPRQIHINRVEYDIPALHRLVDNATDHPDYPNKLYTQAYKQGMANGRHWNIYMK